MKRAALLGLVVLFVLVSAGAAVAAPAETGHYSSDWYYEQVYSGWGPACCYGEDVKVVYEAVNSWTYVVKGDDVRETLVQNGTASIYSTATGTLLDVRAFHVVERFYDAGGDVAVRHDSGSSVWYQVSQNPYTADLEEYQYIWKIAGVYDFRVWNRGGDISWGWISGDCTGGTWPVHPPHPDKNN